MTDLMEKSLITLEFPAVLALLAAQAVCDETKERIEHIRPSFDAREVALLLRETTAARTMMDLHGAPALTNLRPVAAALQRASLGGVLNTRELLQIASVLRTARNVASYSGVGEERTCIHSIFRSLSPNKYLEEKISGAILSEDEIGGQRQPGAGRYPAENSSHLRQGAGGTSTVDLILLGQIPPGGHRHHPGQPVCGAGEGRVQRQRSGTGA